jgi:hypothetical protein
MDACPIAAHLIGRWSGGVDARGQDAVDGCQNSRPSGSNDAEGLRDLVSLGKKEF